MDHHTPTTPATDARCAGSEPGPAARTAIFPPRDADPEARRRWVAASPWPEVVFAVAGHR